MFFWQISKIEKKYWTKFLAKVLFLTSDLVLSCAEANMSIRRFWDSLWLCYYHFPKPKMSKMTFYRTKIDSVAHCKLSITAPFTKHKSKPWPLSLGHLQWWGRACLAALGPQGGQKMGQKWGFWPFFPTLKPKMSSVVPQNQAWFCPWLGFLVRATVSEYGCVGAGKWGQNWSKMFFFF